jgi:hypothetical protein
METVAAVPLESVCAMDPWRGRTAAARLRGRPCRGGSWRAMPSPKSRVAADLSEGARRRPLGECPRRRPASVPGQPVCCRHPCRQVNGELQARIAIYHTVAPLTLVIVSRHCMVFNDSCVTVRRRGVWTMC